MMLTCCWHVDNTQKCQKIQKRYMCQHVGGLPWSIIGNDRWSMHKKCERYFWMKTSKLIPREDMTVWKIENSNSSLISKWKNLITKNMCCSCIEMRCMHIFSFPLLLSDHGIIFIFSFFDKDQWWKVLGWLVLSQTSKYFFKNAVNNVHHMTWHCPPPNYVFDNVWLRCWWCPSNPYCELAASRANFIAEF